MELIRFHYKYTLHHNNRTQSDILHDCSERNEHGSRDVQIEPREMGSVGSYFNKVSYYPIFIISLIILLNLLYLISEGIFACANVFSSLKLVYIFTINPHLGPLQISLGRMVFDIMKFIVLILLVVFSFSCGLNQLYWYYAQMRSKQCHEKEFENYEEKEDCFLKIKYFSKYVSKRVGDYLI